MVAQNHFFLLFVLSAMFIFSLSEDPSSQFTPESACNITPHPSFCKSIYPPSQGSQNLYSYGRSSLSKSLSNSYKVLGAINKYISDHPSSLSMLHRMALEDCQTLLGLNIDSFSSASSKLNSTTSLPDSQADTLHTSLSATLTNLETCLDGIVLLPDILNVLSKNAAKHYSVTLAFSKHAWFPNKKISTKRGFTPSRIPKKPGKGRINGRKLLFHEVKTGSNGELPLKMSMGNREKYERTGRKILQSFDSVLVTKVVIVSQDGTGDFTTIMSAVNAAPNNTNGVNGYHLISVSAGLYEEYISIPKNKKYLMMVGDGINQTVITGNRNVIDGWTTFESATFIVVSQGFVGVGMTIRNTAGPAKHQAVALRSGADLSTFYNCSFEAYQDTLYTHSMRQFYRECDIYGTIDFIFGNAAAVLQSCNIYPRLPMPSQSNMVTAQGRTDPNQNTGMSIQGCTIVLAEDLGTTKTYLGRPWKEYSRTVVMQSFIEGLIHPAGWMIWSGDFALSTLYYAEYNNTGPGAGTGGRVSWPGYRVINGTDALGFTVENFLFGDMWLPQSGVPFQIGLI